MKLKRGLSLQTIGNENILVSEGLENVDFTNIVTLNNSATKLWKAIGCEDFTEDTIVDFLCSWYDIDCDTATKDAKELIDAWMKAGLIQGE